MVGVMMIALLQVCIKPLLVDFILCSNVIRFSFLVFAEPPLTHMQSWVIDHVSNSGSQNVFVSQLQKASDVLNGVKVLASPFPLLVCCV